MIVKVNSIGDGELYKVSCNHSDDFKAQVANTSAHVEKELEYSILDRDSNSEKILRKFKKGLEGLIILESKEATSAISLDTETDELLLFKHAEKFLRDIPSMNYTKSYQDPFYVNIIQNNNSQVVKLPQEEFEVYLSLMSYHMTDLIETYQGKSTERNRKAMIESAQSIREFFWGYDVYFEMDKEGIIPAPLQGDNLLRFIKHDIKEGTRLALSARERQKGIAKFFKERFGIKIRI